MIHFTRKVVHRMDIQQYWGKGWKAINEEYKGNPSFDVLMLYKEDKYYGYIDMEFPIVRMIPDYYPNFEPQEIRFDDRIIEYAEKIFLENNIRWIPIKGKNENKNNEIFLEWTDLSSDNIAEIITNYERYGQDYELCNLFDKDKIVCLSELNETTYKLYWMFKKMIEKYWEMGIYGYILEKRKIMI